MAVLCRLVSYGAQDIYISGNPQITFWKVLYKRHTNFAMESIEVTFNGQADFGRRVTAVISRNADLMYRTYIQVTLPQISLLNPNDRFRWAQLRRSPPHQAGRDRDWRVAHRPPVW